MAKSANQIYDPTNGSIITTGSDSNGVFANLLGIKIYSLTIAITANSTPTLAAAGSLGKTSHATGRASLFVSNGTTWQYLTNA